MVKQVLCIMAMLASVSAIRLTPSRFVNKVNRTSSPTVSAKKTCQIRMTHPYEGFKYWYEIDGDCFKCNAFHAMEIMPQEVFVGLPCTSSDTKNDMCANVLKTRNWASFCVCGTLRNTKGGQPEDMELRASIAFPGLDRGSNLPCGPQACWDFFKSVQERRAWEMGSKTWFSHNAIDKEKMMSECASCSSGALPREKQEECSALQLGLGAGESAKATAKESDEWVLESELTGDDSGEEAIVRKNELEKSKTPVNTSIGTDSSIDTSDEGTQTMAPSEEELLKKMLEEQKQLYEDLLIQVRAELATARQDIASQAEFANSHCFSLIEGLKKQLKESQSASWQKERLKMIESHNTQIQLLTTNFAATGNADKATLEAHFMKLLLEAKTACDGEKQALTEQLQNQCTADISAAELKVKSEASATCQADILVKINANDEEWKKKEIIWVNSNKELEEKAFDAKAKQATAEEQWRKFEKEKIAEAAARKKAEELLIIEREAWIRERKILEEQVLVAQRTATAQQNMAKRAQENCDDEKKNIQSECQISLNGFRATCEKHMKMCMDQKQNDVDVVKLAEDRCNQQIIHLYQQNNNVNVTATFETRWNVEVKNMEDNCEASKQEQYRELERQCGDLIQQAVAKARTEESGKYTTEITSARNSWSLECASAIEKQKEAWVIQAKTEYEQKVNQMEQACNVQIESQIQMQSQLQQQIQTIYAAGVKEYQRAETCIVQGQSAIQAAEERVSLCQTQGNQIIVQFKAALQESQAQCVNARAAEVSELTQKHQQETAAITQANHDCMEKLASQGRLTEIIDAKHQQVVQQSNSLTAQLSECQQSITDLRSQAQAAVNQLQVEVTQQKSYVSVCSQELTTIKSQAQSAVDSCQNELGQCKQQAETALAQQAQTAKNEMESLEQRYLASFKQHQDLFNQEVKKSQQCQEQITIVNAQSRELTIQYKSGIDSCISECNGALEIKMKSWEEKYTQAIQTARDQHSTVVTNLEKQLSDCVNGLSNRNATAQQQLLAFQEQLKQARIEVNTHQERFQQCFNEGNRIISECDQFKGECARKEAAANDMKNQCTSAVNQLQQQKQAADNQVAQCTEQLRAATLMMEQPQDGGNSNNLPFCPICMQYCTSPDVRVKLYKGGWFLPGHQSLPFSDPNKRAPAGGCVCCLPPGYLPVKERSFLQTGAKALSSHPH